MFLLLFCVNMSNKNLLWLIEQLYKDLIICSGLSLKYVFIPMCQHKMLPHKNRHCQASQKDIPQIVQWGLWPKPINVNYSASTHKNCVYLFIFPKLVVTSLCLWLIMGFVGLFEMSSCLCPVTPTVPVKTRTNWAGLGKLQGGCVDWLKKGLGHKLDNL